MRRRENRNYSLRAGVVILAVLVLAASTAPFFFHQSYSDQDVMARNLGSSLSHLFGTDKFGRDLFVRTMYGTRISLFLGVGSMVFCGTLGTAAGSFAGYKGGKADLLMMRAAELADSIPSLLYVILFTLTFGANGGSILLGICVSGWTEPARIVRGEVARLKEKEYSLAARLAGVSPVQIVCRHLLPNAKGPILASLTYLVPKAIFTETFLSFLGVGIAAPKASLGMLISDARSQMRLYPWQMLYPVAVLCLLMLSLQMIGMGLKRSNS